MPRPTHPTAPADPDTPTRPAGATGPTGSDMSARPAGATGPVGPADPDMPARPAGATVPGGPAGLAATASPAHLSGLAAPARLAVLARLARSARLARLARPTRLAVPGARAGRAGRLVVLVRLGRSGRFAGGGLAGPARLAVVAARAGRLVVLAWLGRFGRFAGGGLAGLARLGVPVVRAGRIGRLAVVVGALVVGLVVAPTAAPAVPAVPAAPVQAEPSVEDAAFFTPPDPLPAGAPGDVIRARPARNGPTASQALAQAWQVMYRSTDVTGAPNAVTGTVLVPRGVDPATAPIVGFGPGTHGPAFRCAPSLMVAAGGFYEQPAVDAMLRRGWAVAMTDYEGYHPDPATTYMTGPSMGHALLDVVRAAPRLPGTGLSPTAPVALRGYSQGGGAALWAGQRHPAYAPELDLVGVAAGGVPADLVQVGLPLDGADGYGFFLATLLGMDNAHADVDLAPHLNDAGRAAVARMEEGTCVLELILELGGRSLADHTATSPLTAAMLGHIVESRLGSGSSGGDTVAVPVFQYHEVADGLVAPAQAATLRDTYCRQGVTHTWRTYDTAGATGLVRHVNLVYRANDDVDRFLADRLAGAPPSSTC